MNQTRLSHLQRSPFTVSDNKLIVGGLGVEEIARRAGRTPFYVYDLPAISARVAELRGALPHGVKLHYAIKANPFAAIVNHIAPQVDGLDVASLGELEIALDSGIAAREISFAGPAKSEAELRAAAAAGVLVNVESDRELHILSSLAREIGRRPRVALRVNPDFELKTSGMKMSGGPKQFGIDAERIPQLLSQLRDLPLEFEGFHIFTGSQNLRADAIVQAQTNSVELAIALARHAPGPIRVLNIGGGFGIPYFPGDQPLDLGPICTNLATLLERVRAALGSAEVVIELGRYIVGEAGAYVCRVVDRKISRGQVFLVCDGGLHQHLAASGNFGQVLRKNFPVIIGNRVLGRTETASVVGPLCTPLDLLGDRMELPEASPGDLVVVLQSGAYGYSASPLGFLGHPAPAQLCVP